MDGWIQLLWWLPRGRKPVDKLKATHPEIQNCISSQKCTRNFTGDKNIFGQFVYQCNQQCFGNNKLVCEYCSKNCHLDIKEHKCVEMWRWHFFCSCPKCWKATDSSTHAKFLAVRLRLSFSSSKYSNGTQSTVWWMQTDNTWTKIPMQWLRRLCNAFHSSNSLIDSQDFCENCKISKSHQTDHSFCCIRDPQGLFSCSWLSLHVLLQTLFILRDAMYVKDSLLALGSIAESANLYVVYISSAKQCCRTCALTVHLNQKFTLQTTLSESWRKSQQFQALLVWRVKRE